MSPTVSSSQTSSPNATGYASTTKSSVVIRTKGSYWMFNKTKRAKLGHYDDGATDARRERQIMQEHSSGTIMNALPTPPKDTLLPHSEAASRIPSPSSVRNPIFPNKPLPSPPIATFTTQSPFKEARSLIDASEIPLRRSPAGDPHEQEDWPVLSPARPATAIKLIQSTGQTGRSSPSGTSTSSKYSTMPMRRAPLSKFNPARRSASIDSISCKPLPNVNFPADAKDLPRPASTLSEPTKSGAIETSDLNMEAANSTEGIDSVYPSLSDVPAVEKPTRALRDFPTPRQTRTSALRARLSSGGIDTTVGNKPNGESTYVAKAESRGATPVGPAIKRITPTLINVPVRRTSTADPLKQHNSRRNSGIPRASPHCSPGTFKASPSGNPPNRPAPSPFDGDRKDNRGMGSNHGSRRMEFSNRDASAFPHQNGSPSSDTNSIVSGKRPSRAKFPPSKENASRGIPRKVQSTIPLISQQSAPKSIEALESLPSVSTMKDQEYRVKRLSKSYPDGGPILKISASAERMIMGDEAAGDDRPRLRTKKSRDLRRSIFAKEVQKTSKEPLPLSNGRLSESPPSPPPVNNPEEISKKQRPPIPENPAHKSRSSEDSKISLPTPKSQYDDDPFFDGPSRPSITITDSESVNDESAQPSDVAQRNSFIKEEGAWISSSNQKRISLARSGSLQSSQLKSTVNELKDLKQPSRNSGNDFDGTLIPSLPKNGRLQEHPELENQVTMSACLIPPPREESSSYSLVEILPPRSSSRTIVRDYGSASARTSPSLSPTEVGKKLEREFNLRQDKLGDAQGVGSSQLEVNNVLNRGSIASTSNKSQRSLSKAMLSNLKGLFHKRPSDIGSPTLPSRAGKTGSSSSSLGKRCPLPPMSEVHPIHRPVAVSKTRPKVVTGQSEVSQIKKTPTSPPTQSPTGPSQLDITTKMAMEILDRAKVEVSNSKRDNLIALGTLVVDAVTQAREAERAMEEAKQAARKAEVAYALCSKSVSDVAKSVQDWRRFVDL
ncbi:MAG: hypothetical protein MMC33_005314 [Icmadophila ericetorum]|nr:hypothetical protein [Icmadophila ericetorum]